MITDHQMKTLRDLWEGCVEFEEAFAMADLDEAQRRHAKLWWTAWERKLEASQRAW